MVIAFMGLTSSRDVTVSRTVSTRNESRPTNFSDHRPDRLSTHTPANWNADAVRRLHASASELASEPCRDAPVNQEPSRQSVPLRSHISTDALLRIGRDTSETNMAGYEYRIFVKALYPSMFSGLRYTDNSPSASCLVRQLVLSRRGRSLVVSAMIRLMHQLAQPNKRRPDGLSWAMRPRRLPRRGIAPALI
jgi:hypothetical protein